MLCTQTRILQSSLLCKLLCRNQMVLKQALNSLACSHTLVPLDKAKESPQHKSTSFGEATETHVLRNLLRGNQVVLKQHDQVNGESATHIHRGESKKQMALVVTLCFPQNRSGCFRRYFPGWNGLNLSFSLHWPGCLLVVGANFLERLARESWKRTVDGMALRPCIERSPFLAVGLLG